MTAAHTEDGFLNGQVKIHQPVAGFRSGLDAVMLAAAVPAGPRSDILELGSGAGVASLCLARRVEGCTICGVEIDPALTELANKNARHNAMQDRVTFFEDDAFILRASLRRQFDHVFCNPPFHGDAGERWPDAARERALRDKAGLRRWIDAGLKRVGSKGTFTTIIRADRLRDVISHLPDHGVSVFPLWPKPIEPAKRVIVQLRKGSRAQSVILAGLVLHDDDGKYTKEADAILRGEALDFDRYR